MGTLAGEAIPGIIAEEDGEFSVRSPEAKEREQGSGRTEAWERDSEERYRSTFDQAAVGILHTSLQGKILECNESFARIVGYCREELVGSDFQAITPPEDRNQGQSAALRLLTGEVSEREFREALRAQRREPDVGDADDFDST